MAQVGIQAPGLSFRCICHLATSSRLVSSQVSVCCVHRMAPVACRSIIKCGISGCTGSCSLSVVENGYNAGKKPATCGTCGKIFPRPNIFGNKSRIASPTNAQKSSVSSWSEALCEQSRGQVETVLLVAMGPCAPSERVSFSSGSVVTSEHAVISGLSAGSFALVQSTSRVDCAVTHGFGGVESVPRATYISTPSKAGVFSLLVSRSQVNMP